MFMQIKMYDLFFLTAAHREQKSLHHPSQCGHTWHEKKMETVKKSERTLWLAGNMRRAATESLGALIWDFFFFFLNRAQEVVPPRRNGALPPFIHRSLWV